MNPAIFVLFSLALNSLLLAVILVIAWRTFERPRHAATWAGAFAASTGQWLAGIASLTPFGDAHTLYLLANGLAAVFAALLLLGFRQRAGLATSRYLLGAAIVFTLSSTATLLYLLSADDLRSAPAMIWWAVALAFSATTMIGRGRTPNAAEKTAIVVLVGFALSVSAISAFGVVTFLAGAARGLAIYHNSLILVAPAEFAASGLALVFLLAADLGEQMRLLATVDPLTGILNRRGLTQAAAIAIANCRRQHQPLAVVIADLDRFKAINDAFGHSVGDGALQLFAQHIFREVRGGDPVARIGGEEFAFLLVNTPPLAAIEVVERIRASMAALVLDGGGAATMTASFGVAAVRPDETGLDDILARADAALYVSKQSGRNRVTLAEP